MTLTVRTDHRVSEALAQYCAQAGQTNSDVVKLALAVFFAKRAPPKATVWDGVKDFVLALKAESTSADRNPSKTVKQARDRKKHLSDYYAQCHAHRRGPADRAA